NDSHKEEAFANAVLEIVQRIQYNSSNVKFPIETLLENSGDCDPLSILYASIMKAGGLDVVLFFYATTPISHVNVGVYLNKDPIYQIGKIPFYYEYEGKKYFTVETVADFWKVGDQPEGLHDIKPTIISPEDHQTSSPLQISSNIDNPSFPSSISMNLTPNYLDIKDDGTTIKVSGSIFPKYSNQPIFLNIIHNSFLSFNTFKSVTTNEVGNYSFIWNFNSSGTYSIQASWNGLQKYAGSVSEKLTFYIGLSQMLDDYKINNTVSIGPEIIPITELNSSGNRIMEYQTSRKILEKNFTQTNVILSAEFIVLRNNESTTSEQKLTIPSFEYTILNRRRNITRTIPEKTFLIPNYKQKMNNHFEFKIVQTEKKKYISSVSILNDYDFSQIINNPNLIFYDDSHFSNENNWHKIEAVMIEDKISLKLFDDNFTYFSETISLDYNTQDNFRILLKYEPDSIIAIKDLRIESLDQPNPDKVEVNMFDFSKIFTEKNSTSQSIDIPKPEKELTESISVELPIFQIFMTSCLSAAFLVFIVFYRKRRK
ncbi:MAG: Ig-like domain-containing protein, partial [Candidatus Bathyarchaeota archaeon]